MANKNRLSHVAGASSPLTRHRPGSHQFYVRLILTLFFITLTSFLKPVAQALSTGPTPAEASFLQGGEQEPLTIGVIELGANGVEDSEARAISERLRTWLGRTGAFQVIERNRMVEIMEEMGFQASGACNTDECVVQVGQVLGASKMVAGSVSRVGNLYSLQIRMIDIATSRIEHPLFEDVNGIEAVLLEATRNLANELAAWVTGQPIDPGQPATPTSAQVTIQSNPPGATVTVDGSEVGSTTPVTVPLAEGDHVVVVRLSGYGVVTQTVPVVAGQDQTVTIPLADLPKGFLTVISVPSQCQVFVDGNLVGNTPITRHEVDVGSHRVELRRTGYETQIEQLDITARQTYRIDLTMLRAGAAQLTFQNTLAGARLTITGDEERDARLNNAEESIPIPPGNYSLTVKAKGYRTWRETVQLADGENPAFPIVLQRKSRVAAGLLSVIPGMGHIYSGRGFMGVLYLAGVAGSAVAVISEKENYRSVSDEYDRIVQSYRNATTSDQIDIWRDRMDSKYVELIDSHDSMNNTAMIMSVIWGVSILDAFALLPRLRPIPGANIQSDLALGTQKGRLNLTLSVAFK
ncbi:PEGA domain-containing protein [Gemmatimonadota bacterium]